MTYGTANLATPDESDRSTTAKLPLGFTMIGADGFVYVYVQANGAIAANQTDIAMTAAFQASDGAGVLANTTAFADNEYGFIRTNVVLALGSDA